MKPYMSSSYSLMFKSLYISIYHLRALKFSKPKPAHINKTMGSSSVSSIYTGHNLWQTENKRSTKAKKILFSTPSLLSRIILTKLINTHYSTQMG